MKKGVLFFAAAVLLVIAACTTSNTPTSPTTSQSGMSATLAHAGHGTPTDEDGNPVNSAAGEDKGYIDGWFNGENVQLYYTKTFFCTEPPDSAAFTHCELGADAETAPRPGPIPTIYAIAAAFQPPPPLETLACRPGSVCLNHPAMIDASRVGLSATAPAAPHSHILSEHAGGWFHTVNVRVRNLSVWNQIVAAKSLEKVRELQADPNIGVNSLNPQISADTKTNIFFFIASWRPADE